MRVLENLHDVDRRWLLLLQQSESWLAQHARILSRSADGYLYVLLGGLVTLSADAGSDFLLYMLIAFAVERVVYWLMKNSLKRKRPAQSVPGFKSQIIASDEFSFPSGHTSAAFLFVTLLTVQLGPACMILYPWAMAVGLSRVYLGVHFPTDTVMGALLGTSIAVTTAGFLY